MAFEVFSAEKGPPDTPTLAIQPNGTIRLNTKSTDILKRERAKRVLVLWDKDARKLGIKPVDANDPRAYRITFSARRNSASVGAKAFARSLGWLETRSIRMAAEWVDSMLQATIPAEHLRGSDAGGPTTRKKKPDL